MKIGVLTYFGEINCGTNLQAYATYMAVKKIYPHDQVEVVPIHTFDAISKYKRYLPFLTWFIHHKIEKKYKEFKENKLNVSGDTFIYDIKEALSFIADRKYDKIYVGADTVLELNKDGRKLDMLTVYWLKDVKADKYLIAASAGSTEYEELSDNQKSEMEVAVSQLKKIGIRDRGTARLISHFIDSNEIKYVLDPTFTLDIDYRYAENYLRQKGIAIPQKAVLIHASFDEKWPRKIVKKFHRLGYKVFAPRFNSWADVCLNDMSPLEQLGIYKYFSLVVTHRFHDSVFCLKNNTPVLIYVKSRIDISSKNGDSKHVSNLKDFNLYPVAFLGCSQDPDFFNFDIEARINELQKEFNPQQISAKISENANGYFDYLKSTI